MLANRPMQKDVNAAIAAVPVMKSRWMMPRQRLYSILSAQVGSFASVQTHVPPLSVKMVALTYFR
jgi:hypothetical protein